MSELIIKNLQEISAVAVQFIAAMGEHRVIAFYGEMGTGKTTFIQAICKNLGVTDVINSPTFSIVNEYLATNGEIFHFDFYRIKKLEEVYDMGYEEYFYGNGFCFIEWPELVESLLPDDVLRVHIKELSDGSRSVSF
ncbi:MAG: tRNA (adenosine(37)-N6)-threonylcarbamoyltransferase complex ATPase subunit type 1 TsaE [Bacteroidaceae bacterium]